jgi:hypothetical protein
LEAVLFILGRRSPKKYLSTQIRYAPFGGSDLGKHETPAQILAREVKEELIGNEWEASTRQYDPCPLSAEAEKVVAIIDKYVRDDNIILLHQELIKHEPQGWWPSVDGFYILQNNLTDEDFSTLQKFVLKRNVVGGLAQFGEEVDRFDVFSVRDILDRVLEGPDGKRQILSMDPEDFAFQRALHHFVYKFNQSATALLPIVAEEVFDPRAKLLRSLELKYLPNIVQRTNRNGVSVGCRVLDLGDPKAPIAERQPAIAERAVVAHSRGPRFLEVAKDDGSFVDRFDNTHSFGRGQIIATVMDFDEKGMLSATEDVYLPKNDFGHILTAGNFWNAGYRPYALYPPAVGRYSGSEHNGIYVRERGNDFYILMNVFDGPTVVGRDVFEKDDALIYRSPDIIEGLPASLVATSVVSMPRFVASLLCERRDLKLHGLGPFGVVEARIAGL